MPGPVKRLAVVAAVEGLIIHPLGQRNQRSIQIAYVTAEISSLGPSSFPSSFTLLEAHGIVGLLTVAPVSYLIAILRREQVAQIKGVPVYVITDVALIPLSSQSEARRAIDQAKDSLNNGSGGSANGAEDNDTSDDEEVHAEDRIEEDEQSSPTSSGSRGDLPAMRPDGPGRSTSNVAQDVLARKGQYGRFAERWFSKKGWSTEKRRAQGSRAHLHILLSELSTLLEIANFASLSIFCSMTESQVSTEDTQKLPSSSAQGEALQSLQSRLREAKQLENDPKSQDAKTDVANTLIPKLLRTTRMLLISRSFFFSYDYDITRRLGQGNTSSEIPLHKSVDQLFFWNHHLALPFIDGGHHTFVLPLMQGFIGQRVFSLVRFTENSSDAVSGAEQDVGSVVYLKKQAETGEGNTASSSFLITLISRRSIKRPGLRYLRRGVDDKGETANTVETEQIVSKASWASNERVHSFTQIRGSIPLFFSQSPYSFKPVPVLQHTSEMNQRAFKRHFANIVGRYGNVQIVLLVDKKGGEAEIGRKYEESTTKIQSEDGVLGKKLRFEWFDFHTVCRGMKFEKVSLLMEALGSKLDEIDETVETQNKVQKRQSGIIRTNCMDCLDRTNVVQSACGQRVLEKQLREEGFKVDLLTDSTTQWFNTLWADNGDQISREYSSTAALKGDYTRTRQRNYRGAINDLGLTLSRYYNNIVNDYFSQAAIDYLLGNVTAQVFDEFEATLGNRDPAMSMNELRATAIETSSKIVIADQKEDLVGGWMLMSPQEQNTVRTFPFDECVLLITDAALYHVKFDWNVEKVASFERVDMRSIIGITKGTYITSTLAPTQSDPERNVGFVIKYKPGKDDIARVNTRSLSSAVGLDDSESAFAEGSSSQYSKKEDPSALKVLAFKALPARDSFTSAESREPQAMSEKEMVSNVCEEIKRAAVGGDSSATGFVEEKDIISLQEARKSTGLIEHWGHRLKKMVWA